MTRPYLLLYPEPNGKETGATGLYSVQVTSPTHENYALGKIDHALSNSHSLAVRYSWDKAQVDQDTAIPYWTTDTRTTSQSIVGEHKWIVRPSVLNVAKVAWNRAYEATDNIEKIAFDPKLFFVPGTRFGNISVSGINAIGPDTNTPTFVDLKSLQFIDNLTWSRNSHNVKTGINYTYYMNDQDSSFDYGGNYSFTSENFLQNRPGTYEGQAQGSTTDRRWRQSLVGPYAGRLTARNLTVNMGVRHEFTATPREPVTGARWPGICRRHRSRRRDFRT